MPEITCSRCNRTGDQLSAPPLPTELGSRIYQSICQSCWGEWLQYQTALINHYGLNLVDPKARKFLTEQTEDYLFGDGEQEEFDPDDVREG